MSEENVNIMILLNELSPKEKPQEEEIVAKLTQYVEALIANDFSKLVDILYRVDVNEKKLKQRLEQAAPTDAAKIIAAALYERQKQKLTLRTHFSSQNQQNCDEEKW